VTAAITFDSRRARPLAVDVGDPGVSLATISWDYIDYAMSRGSASDALGNKVEQTIIRAYGLAP